MKAQVQKWGNSLAVRIPKAFADEVGLAANTAVELTISEGQLIVAPLRANEYVLDALLEQITADNLHHEVDTGDAVGNEAW